MVKVATTTGAASPHATNTVVIPPPATDSPPHGRDSAARDGQSAREGQRGRIDFRRDGREGRLRKRREGGRVLRDDRPRVVLDLDGVVVGRIRQKAVDGNHDISDRDIVCRDDGRQRRGRRSVLHAHGAGLRASRRPTGRNDLARDRRPGRVGLQRDVLQDRQVVFFLHGLCVLVHIEGNHLGGIRFFAGRVDREQLEIDGALVGLEGERARSKSDRGRRDDIRVRERSLRVAPDGLNLRDVVVAVSGPGDAEGDVARESGIVADRRLQRDDRLGNLRVVALRGVADDYDAIAAVAALVEGFDIAATAAAAAAEPVHASRRR